MSMDKFGAALGVSRVAVSRLESGDNNPSKQTVLAICKTFGISEEWLRTGEGEMKAALSREQEIADIMNRMLADEPDSYRTKLISYVSRMSDEQIALLNKMVTELYNELNEKQPD